MAYLQNVGVSIAKRFSRRNHTRSAILRLVIRYAVISAVLLWRRLPRAKSESELLGSIQTCLPVNIHMVAVVAGAADSHNFAVAEEVRNCVEVYKMLADASDMEAMMSLRIVVWLGWVLLRWWSSISSVISRSWVS